MRPPRIVGARLQYGKITYRDMEAHSNNGTVTVTKYEKRSGGTGSQRPGADCRLGKRPPPSNAERKGSGQAEPSSGVPDTSILQHVAALLEGL